MVAGALGGATALLIYSLLINFLSPGYFISASIHTDDQSSFNRFEKILVNHSNRSTQQTNNVMGNFGHGKHVLVVTFIHPSLYKRVKKHSKPTTRLQQREALIITICLLLSGDIHPCPGPGLHHARLLNNLDPTSDSAVSQVRTCGSGALLPVEQTNLPRSRSLGSGDGALPGWSVMAGERVAEAERLGVSKESQHANLESAVDQTSDSAVSQVHTCGISSSANFEFDTSDMLEKSMKNVKRKLVNQA